MTTCVNSNHTSLLMPDKGDGTDSETGVQEDDFSFQDEMIKSRLCALKRVWLFPVVCFIYLFIYNNFQIFCCRKNFRFYMH